MRAGQSALLFWASLGKSVAHQIVALAEVAVTALALLLAGSLVAAPPRPIAPPPKVETKQPLPPEAEFFAQMVGDLLRKNVPDPLTKSNMNWGHQKAETVIKRRREGLRFWTEPVQEFHNDGVWRRVEVRIADPSKLLLGINELTYPSEGKMLATVAVACERVDLKFEQQVWRNGTRLYAGETRGHCEAGIILKVVVTTKTEYKKGGLLPIPEFAVQVKATEAFLFHNQIIIDQTGPFDGEAAKSVGEAMLRLVKAFKPDLEGDILEKANVAILKAAGTREFKVALDKVLGARK